MSVPAPHFLLFSESHGPAGASRRGDWRFVLQAIDGSTKLEVEDAEPSIRGERLELLAVVRGLEALEQPSRVTLVTPSRYVSRGLTYGLQDWRENGWQWENHGAMVPIKNHDLWQRLDRALAFHRLECRPWRFDAAETDTSERKRNSRPAPTNAKPPLAPAGRPGFERRIDAATSAKLHAASNPRLPPRAIGAVEKLSVSREANIRASKTIRANEIAKSSRALRRFVLASQRRLAGCVESLRLRLAQCATSLLPAPWLD